MYIYVSFSVFDIKLLALAADNFWKKLLQRSNDKPGVTSPILRFHVENEILR